MEEELKILEERVIMLKRHIRYYEESDCKTDRYHQLVKECNAIENLLKRYKELEEENTRLREDVEGYSGLAKQIQEEYENRIDEFVNRDRFE
jgi:5'-deoxynucleotidase YfbR-like HD superfamily hydrolase